VPAIDPRRFHRRRLKEKSDGEQAIALFFVRAFDVVGDETKKSGPLSMKGPDDGLA